ncbi:MAG TPA: PhzF family phenazine biosynthesis protein [Mycobacteriales bacterium]|nr:PhzF family phenazine biosynthesis protein [Mycobacteriales bacterium]
MTGHLAFEVVDVFTDTAFAGNPLAVVLGAEQLQTSQLQALAREFNLSETAFPMPAPDGDDVVAPTATYGLRIFTPTTELPFAGHPSVGSASVLHRLGRIAIGPNVQACGAGLLPVEVSEDSVTLTGGAPTVGPPVEAAPVLTALGLQDADLVGPAIRWAGAGIEFAHVLVRPEALDAVRPDTAAVAALGGSGVSLSSWDGETARTRVFPGGVGIFEDPATGSAALGFGVFLAASDLLGDGTHQYVVRQGVEMGRPSTLRCSVEVSGGVATTTRVSGSSVPIARGEIRVP